MYTCFLSKKRKERESDSCQYIASAFAWQCHRSLLVHPPLKTLLKRFNAHLRKDHGKRWTRLPLLICIDSKKIKLWASECNAVASPLSPPLEYPGRKPGRHNLFQSNRSIKRKRSVGLGLVQGLCSHRSMHTWLHQNATQVASTLRSKHAPFLSLFLNSIHFLHSHQ